MIFDWFLFLEFLILFSILVFIGWIIEIAKQRQGINPGRKL